MKKINKNMERTLKKSTILFITILIAVIIVLLILKYQVEGEKNMPFQLGKIMVISSAEGLHKEDSENTWNMDIIQNNDIYIEIDKNKNYKDTEVIDKVTLDNFNIISNTQIGEITIYKPSTNENKTYEYLENLEIKDNLVYTGSSDANIKNLEIANQGGMILLRYSIKDIGEYISSEESEIRHDGTLLAKTEINMEQIKCKVTFDLTIALKSAISYKGTITLDLPAGNIIDEGTSSVEITDFKDVIFKRQ